MAEPERERGLDGLRALVVVGLIFFHGALVFDLRDDYYVKSDRLADLAPLAAVGVVWAMPLLFLAAGLGVWHSLGRRGPGGFARERLLRLVVPLVFGVLVLMPIPQWFRQRADPDYDESYLEFYPRFLRVRLDWSDFPFVVQGVPPDDLFETGQLWFVVLLVAFSFLLLPLLWWLRRGRRGMLSGLAVGAGYRGAVLLPAVPLALVSAALDFEEPHALWNRWAYLLFFLYGFVLASDQRFLGAVRRHAVAAAGLGLLTFGVAFALIGRVFAEGGDPFTDDTPVAVAGRFLFGAAGWLWLVAILGLLTRRRPVTESAAPEPAAEEPAPAGAGARQHRPAARIGAYAAAAVLPLYILHQPVLVAIAFFVVDWPIHPVVAYLVISLATLLGCLALYEGIRRTRPTRFLFGMRPATGSGTSDRPGGTSGETAGARRLPTPGRPSRPR